MYSLLFLTIAGAGGEMWSYFSPENVTGWIRKGFGGISPTFLPFVLSDAGDKLLLLGCISDSFPFNNPTTLEVTPLLP